MKQYFRRDRVSGLAMMLLLVAGILSSTIIPVPALAEGGSPPLPPVILPADTTLDTAAPSTTGDASAMTATFEIVLLVLETVL